MSVFDRLRSKEQNFELCGLIPIDLLVKTRNKRTTGAETLVRIKPVVQELSPEDFKKTLCWPSLLQQHLIKILKIDLKILCFLKE